MVYKKYIKKDGKLYGPYTYHSKRVGNKVMSEYCGINKPNYKKFVFLSLGVLVLIFLAFFFFGIGKLTGNAILTSQDEENKISLSLKPGELIPSSSIVIFEDKNQKKYEYNLSDLTAELPVQGNYYVDGKSISGNGEGYGTEGNKKIFPEVYFELTLKSSQNEEKSDDEQINERGNETEEIENQTEQNNFTEQNPIEPNEENPEQPLEQNSENQTEPNAPAEQTSEQTVEEEQIPLQTPDETANNELASEINQNPADDSESAQTGNTADAGQISETANNEQTSETGVENSNTDSNEGISAPITGNIVSRLFRTISNFFLSLKLTGNAISESTEIKGSVSADKPFIYNLNADESIELVSGSVKTDSQNLEDNAIEISRQEGRIVISTQYYNTEKGFGKDYFGEERKILDLNLPENISQNNLRIKIQYDGEDLLLLGENEKTGNFTNETLPVSAIDFSVMPLSNREKEILADEFANISLKTTKAELFHGRYVIKYQLGDYNVEYSYDAEMNDDVLYSQMEYDRIKWLRDIIGKLSKNESIHQEATRFISNYSF